MIVVPRKFRNVESLGLGQKAAVNYVLNSQWHQLSVAKLPSNVEKQIQASRIHSKVLSVIGYLLSLQRRAKGKLLNKSR
jgi:hypothetical protein